MFIYLCLAILCSSGTIVESFTIHGSNVHRIRVLDTKLNSFYSDSSDYKTSESDFSSDDDASSQVGVPIQSDDAQDEDPPIEESPVPMSKNSGNRFIAFVFDEAMSSSKGEHDVDVMKLHDERVNLTEDHVLYCRKANLYNETFNSESMADILWSHQILSSDMQRVLGHAMCIESNTVDFAKELISRDPIVHSLTGGDVSQVPFYRWRHIRDITLRQDDGRAGVPYLLFCMDRSAEEGVGNLRESVSKDFLEYLIRSERVIATGPLHLSTEFKDDPSSIPVGDLILFNAPTREDAIEFAENSPAALSGLYANMKLHRYNSLDVTGKFVAGNLVDPSKTKHTDDMKEAMEHWGYPVDDMQTKWLNW